MIVSADVETWRSSIFSIPLVHRLIDSKMAKRRLWEFRPKKGKRRTTIYEYKGRVHREDGPAKIIEDDAMREVEYYRYGVLHRDNDLPAVIKYSNGKVVKEEWYNDGKRHRDGEEPALIEKKKGIVHRAWYKKGRLYRESGPALNIGNTKREGYANGHATREITELGNGELEYVWYDKGKCHRDERDEEGKTLPAVITYHSRDSVKRKEWYMKSILYREEDEPSRMEYDKKGNISGEVWTNTEGQLHREDGPAVMTVKENIIIYEWWINGVLERKDGPAIQRFLQSFCGLYLISDEWYKNNLHHRSEGPAVIFYDTTNGNPVIEEWWSEGKLIKERKLINGEWV